MGRLRASRSPVLGHTGTRPGCGDAPSDQSRSHEQEPPSSWDWGTGSWKGRPQSGRPAVGREAQPCWWVGRAGGGGSEPTRLGRGDKGSRAKAHASSAHTATSSGLEGNHQEGPAPFGVGTWGLSHAGWSCHVHAESLGVSGWDQPREHTRHAVASEAVPPSRGLLARRWEFSLGSGRATVGLQNSGSSCREPDVGPDPSPGCARAQLRRPAVRSLGGFLFAVPPPPWSPSHIYKHSYTFKSLIKPSTVTSGGAGRGGTSGGRPGSRALRPRGPGDLRVLARCRHQAQRAVPPGSVPSPNPGRRGPSPISAGPLLTQRT